MSETEAIHLLARGIVVATELLLPVLIVSLVVGVTISLVQAATQVQEMTLSFAPKLGAILAVLVIMGPWMLGQLVDFTRELFTRMAQGRLPILYNCSAGKDRTGLASALLLTLLGVDEATIEQDYMLSNDVIDAELSLRSPEVGELEFCAPHRIVGDCREEFDEFPVTDIGSALCGGGWILRRAGVIFGCASGRARC